MPLTRFKLTAIANEGITNAKLADDAVGTDELADGAVTLAKTDSLFVNTEISGTEAARMPVGTTAQREGSPKSGDQRFNSTFNLMEYYDGSIWKSIDSPPSVTGISPENFTASGTTITITGSNFQSGANVKLIDTDGTELTPDSVTLISTSSITFDTTQAMVDNEKDKFDVKVSNLSGLSSTLENILEISDGTFSFTSSATSTLYDSGRSSGFDAGGSISGGGGESDITVSYAVTSGSLPSGGSISSSTGLVTGISEVGSDTVSNFTVTATTTDATSGTETEYTRTFALTVKAPITQTFSYTGSDQSFSVPSGVTAVQVYMWGGAGGGANAESYSDAGGPGGYSDGLLDVSAISSLVVQVASGGGRTDGGSTRPSRPYPNGGLPALRSGYVNGAGGGRSALFDSSVSFANALIIAGGGGGAGGHGGGIDTASNGAHGGSGGGTSGTIGSGSTGAGGAGGTQSTGGPSFSDSKPTGRNGDQLQGADAGDGQVFSAGFNAAGGGGDGYYGGGAVDSAHAGGGGGSGYLHPSLISSGQTLATTSPSGKQTTINPPQTGSSYYGSGIGVGNANASGGNGKVVLVY